MSDKNGLSDTIYLLIMEEAKQESQRHTITEMWSRPKVNAVIFFLALNLIHVEQD